MSLSRSLQHGWRRLRSSPVFAAFSVITLALGIGATTAVYSLIHVMTGPLPGIAGVERVVEVYHYPTGSLSTVNLWLATGQSNLEALAPTPLVSSARVEVEQFGFQNADITTWTPITSAGPFSAVAGAFASTLAQHTHQPIRVVAATRGSQSLSGWEAGGAVREYCIMKVKHEPIAGVVFWQGESDALSYDPTTIDTYGPRLERVIADWRTLFQNPTLPVLIVGLQRYCRNWPADGAPLPTCVEPPEWRAIREAQRRVAAHGTRITFVDVSAMTNGDLHPRDAYAAIGKALAAAVTR